MHSTAIPGVALLRTVQLRQGDKEKAERTELPATQEGGSESLAMNDTASLMDGFELNL